MIIVDRDMSAEQIADLLNGEIDKRRSYGVRKETVPRGVKARRVHWRDPIEKSNVWNKDLLDRYEKFGMIRGDWIVGEWKGVDYYATASGKTIEADANAIVVGNLPNWTIDRKGGYSELIDDISSRLDSLPLAKASFQAKQMGEFDLVDIDPPEGVLRNLDDPLNEQSMIHKLRKESGVDEFSDDWDSMMDDGK